MWSVRCRSNWRTGPTVETVAWKALARNTGRMQIDRSSCGVMKFGEVCIKPHSVCIAVLRCFPSRGTGIVQVGLRHIGQSGNWKSHRNFGAQDAKEQVWTEEAHSFQHTGHFTTQANVGNTTCGAEPLPTVHWHWCRTGFGCSSSLSSVLSMSIWPVV